MKDRLGSSEKGFVLPVLSALSFNSCVALTSPSHTVASRTPVTAFACTLASLGVGSEVGRMKERLVLSTVNQWKLGKEGKEGEIKRLTNLRHRGRGRSEGEEQPIFSAEFCKRIVGVGL